MSIGEKYGYTPEQIGKMSRVQLLLYLGKISAAKKNEVMSLKFRSRSIRNETG